jgi:hypothetical protein
MFPQPVTSDLRTHPEPCSAPGFSLQFRFGLLLPPCEPQQHITFTPCLTVNDRLRALREMFFRNTA